MKYSEVYNKAATLIEKGWTRHAMARDRAGYECNIKSELAVSWCLSGAISAAFKEFSAKHLLHRPIVSI